MDAGHEAPSVKRGLSHIGFNAAARELMTPSRERKTQNLLALKAGTSRAACRACQKGFHRLSDKSPLTCPTTPGKVQTYITHRGDSISTVPEHIKSILWFPRVQQRAQNTANMDLISIDRFQYLRIAFWRSISAALMTDLYSRLNFTILQGIRS